MNLLQQHAIYVHTLAHVLMHICLHERAACLNPYSFRIGILQASPAFQIVLSAQDGAEQAFKVTGDVCVRKIFSMFCQRRELEMTDYHFLLVGERISQEPFVTCRQYDMKSGDVIDVMRVQQGD